MNPKELTGKVALVTGASKALAEAMANSLPPAGATLACWLRRDEKLLGCTAADVAAQGGEAAAFPCDVSDEAQVAALEKSVSARFGRVHILINNAGINLRKPLTDFTLEEWNRIQTTNVTSAFLTCRAFVPHLKGRGYGRILNYSRTSMMSHVSLPGRTACSTSKKRRCSSFTEGPRARTRPGCHYCSMVIGPGSCSTEINKPIMENAELTQFFLSRIPVGRWGKPEEIGQLAVYLCPKAAARLAYSETELVTDGGWITQ